MEGVVLCSRLNNNCVRHQIDSVDFSSDVVAFKERVSQILNLPSVEFELLYCGLIVKDNRKLDFYGIKTGSTIHAVKKIANEVPKIGHENCTSESVGPEKVKQLRRAAMSILAHKSQRHILEAILKNEDTVENLMAATPGLNHDVIALGLVQDLEMFILAATNDKDTLTKICEDHPAFGHAALHLIATINEEAARVRREQPSHSRDTAQAYALDRPSDDEDDDEEDMELDVNPNLGANQVPQANTPGVITSDFFQRAMLMAAGGGPVNPPAPVVDQTQLDQLRDMGITDEGVARRALEQAGGDINLALEMIFGDGI